MLSDIDGNPIMSYLADRSKGNLNIWDVFIVIVSFG